MGKTYTLVRELGGGGMSRVFLATELALDRPVVLKLLPPELASAVSTDRFRQEIRLAARLQHPHIVPLHSAGEADGLLFYTMPLIDGESLRARLARAGELPVREAVRLLRDVAAALAYAHEHGIVHRDIKPDNVLLTGGEALVTDFGVAKALSAAATPESSGLTSLGVALGTPAYMAPEQGAADPHIDHRADLYAWGCLAYECLTGQPPFVGRSPAALLAAHMAEAPEAIDRRRPALPPTLSTLVMRCLEKRPADRPQSAAELLPVLEAVATPSGGMEPTQAVRALPRGSRSVRRKVIWGAVAAMALVGVAMAVGTRGSTAPAALDANLVAVAPFDALGPGLDLWREGFVDLLSRNLDGAGPLRTVSPTVVINRWAGRADPLSATELGRVTGAGLAVYGTLVGAGADSVRLSASILNVGTGQTLGEVQLRGDARRMDALSDSLSVALLRELGRSRPIAAVRAATLRGTSLPALKTFLEGERYYRRGAYDSAAAAYKRTLAIDSTFVPALVHLATSLWWKGGEETEYRGYLLRAGALNHGLPQRDSLIVAAESCFVALELADSLAPEQRRGIVKRMFEALAAATRLYESDPEVWYFAGEARYHHGALARVPTRHALEAFDRAVALDSSFAPAYFHGLELGATVEGRGGWDRRVGSVLAGQASDKDTEIVRIIDALIRADSATGDSLIRAASNDQLFQTMGLSYKLPDSLETALRVARALAGRPAPTRDDALLRRTFVVVNLAFRGHLREARRLLEPMRDHHNVATLTAELGLLGVVPPESTDAVLRDRLDRGAFWPPRGGPNGGGIGSLGSAPMWWAARRDTAALIKYIGRADSVRRAAVVPREAENADMLAHIGRANLTLARGDSAGALRQLEELPRDWGRLARVVQSQLLVKAGKDGEASDWLDRAFPVWWATPASVLARLEHGRIAERLGDRGDAIDDYHFVVDVWRHADPELQGYVTEARSAIARLTAERS